MSIRGFGVTLLIFGTLAAFMEPLWRSVVMWSIQELVVTLVARVYSGGSENSGVMGLLRRLGVTPKA
jgi:hypothetical protein